MQKKMFSEESGPGSYEGQLRMSGTPKKKMSGIECSLVQGIMANGGQDDMFRFEPNKKGPYTLDHTLSKRDILSENPNKPYTKKTYE